MQVEWLPECLGYVGPGAGIALAGSLLALLLSALLGLLAIVAAPVTWLLAVFRRWRRPASRDGVRRVVVLGFDGLDPRLCERWMATGDLPNLSQLAETGTFTRLGTTFPAISPAAWASFSTGVRPSKHSIFDFLAVDRTTYLPELSSVRIRPPRRRVAIAGRWLSFGKPDVVQLRRAIPFWTLLGKRGWPAVILRVPITFPPDRYPGGRQLSGMCVPDLRGTQGTYTLFTTRHPGPTDPGPSDRLASPGCPGESTGQPLRAADSPPPDPAPSTPPVPAGGSPAGVSNVFGSGGSHSGQVVKLPRDESVMRVTLPGPPDPGRQDGRPTGCPLTIKVRANGVRVSLRGGAAADLQPGVYSPWLVATFESALGRAFTGCCRMLLLATEPELELYATPLMIDPRRPVLPVSHPGSFAPYLAATGGRFATLGLAEDTTAMDENVITGEQFLAQAWHIQAERERALTDALDSTPDGVVVAVFDGSDRISHMFWREDSPAQTGGDRGDDGLPTAESVTTNSPVIHDTYRRFDELVGRVRAKLRPNDVLWVMSDHGFTGFHRQVDLNRWLLDAGYLVLADGVDPDDVRWLAGVDWSRTRAYAMGLAGITLNLAGRERGGIVSPDDATAVRAEIASKLLELRDSGSAGEDGVRVVRRALPVPEQMPGPFADRGPDVLVGWAHGYRVSWSTVRGGIAADVIADNTRHWSGDHGVDPQLVPGVWFSSRGESLPDGGPHITDLAPTLLHQFGIEPPATMDGRVLSPSAPASAPVPSAAP